MKLNRLLIPLLFIQLSVFTLPEGHAQPAQPARPAVRSEQTDHEAKNILDRFSKNATTAPSVSMKFKLVNINFTDNTRDTIEGSVLLSRDKYILELPDNLTWFNGETSWSYLPEEKEVTISKPDKKDNSFQNKPSAIFSMYKTGFKYRLLEENMDAYIIDLYPEDIKTEMVRVRLNIGKSKLDLKNLEYKKKDGTSVIIDVLDFTLDKKPSSDTFVFHPEKYKGVEIIDVR
jgi:outer membrane lipoprotein carrier protein